MRRIWRFRALCLVACAAAAVAIAWFAAGDLMLPENAARLGKADVSCDHALEKQATQAWLARAFDLSSVPGDRATAPLQRMLADDRDVFVRSYPAGSYQDEINAIREGTLLVVAREPRQPLDDIDWPVTELGDYYGTKLHGWNGIAELLGSKERLPEDVEAAIASLIRDWFRCNGVPPGVSPSAWYEGTVVMRLSTILLAIDYFRAHGGLGGLRFIDLLYLAATNKDELLVADYPIGNHGLRQDIVLLSYVGNLPYSADWKEVKRLVEGRLNHLAQELFSAEGIWKEHAPGYVHYALRHLTDLDRVAKGSRVQLPILEKAASSAHYLRQILTPEGKLPPIGMSGASDVSRVVAKHWDIGVGKEPYVLDRSVIFEDYGQAVYSSSKGGQLYLLFQAVQNLPAGKRHADELSLIVHNFGRWWLVDSGHHTYEPTPMGEFLPSAQAHNTYIRDERGLRYSDRPDLDVVLTGFSDEEGQWKVSGRSDRFLDDASFERMLVIDEITGRVSVRDSFSEPRKPEKVWRGFLHFAPDLVVGLDGSSVIAKDPMSGREMRIVIQGAANPRIVAGQDDPPQGWIVQDKKVLEAPVLEFQTDGSDEVTMAITWD